MKVIMAKIIWKEFRKTGKLHFYNEKGEMTGNSNELPIFPDYRVGGTQRILRVESYVRKKLNDRWYLIPIIMQWESPALLFGPDVVRDTIKRQQIEAYKALLFYRYAKPMNDGFGSKLNTQLLDIIQVDEYVRLGLVIRVPGFEEGKYKILLNKIRILWNKHIKKIS